MNGNELIRLENFVESCDFDCPVTQAVQAQVYAAAKRDGLSYIASLRLFKSAIMTVYVQAKQALSK